MTELGKKSPCHLVPTFGCPTCIENDRNAWARKTYEDWKKTYRPQNCKRHNKPMFAYDWTLTAASLMAHMSCPVHNGGESFDCEDQDYSVKIG